VGDHHYYANGYPGVTVGPCDKESVVCSSHSSPTHFGGLLVPKSSRPTYAIIPFVVSSLWMCAIFLPLLYSVAFPNGAIQEVIDALKERGTAPPESVAAVQETIEAAGPLKRAFKVAYYSGATTTVGISGPRTSQKVNQSWYVAWLQKLPKPILMTITRAESDGDHRAYRISKAEPFSLGRGYALPVLLFAVSLFLVGRRKSADSSL
jgi:hypothetical protein